MSVSFLNIKSSDSNASNLKGSASNLSAVSHSEEEKTENLESKQRLPSEKKKNKNKIPSSVNLFLVFYRVQYLHILSAHFMNFKDLLLISCIKIAQETVVWSKCLDPPIKILKLVCINTGDCCNRVAKL